MRFRKVITVISQVLVGLLFILSGWIKTNDPKGFGYKLEEYFHVFADDVPSLAGFFGTLSGMSELLSIVISVFEVFVGLCLLLGVFRRFTVWALLLMIIFFTILTYYSAYYNKVTDCGCFGDALKLTPWQSFTKDLVLLLFSMLLFVNSNYLQHIFPNPGLSRRLATGGGIAALLFALFTSYYEPAVDFRPYRVGANIQEGMTLPPDAKKEIREIVFIYKKKADSTQTIEVPMAQLASVDTAVYTYKDRVDKVIQEGDKPAIHDFDIQGPDSSMTQAFLNEKGYRLMIVYKMLDQADTSAQSALNELAAGLMKDKKVKVWAVTASPWQVSEQYVKEHRVPYNFNIMDGTTLKTMLRSNPGLILFRDNVVVKKWSGHALPTKEKVYSYIEPEKK